MKKKDRLWGDTRQSEVSKIYLVYLTLNSQNVNEVFFNLCSTGEILILWFRFHREETKAKKKQNNNLELFTGRTHKF